MPTTRDRATSTTLAIAMTLIGLAATPSHAGPNGIPSAATPAKQITEAVESYLAMVGAMRDASSDPIRTQILVQHQIKESYAKLGKPLEAITEFRALLEATQLPDARVNLHFAIIDVCNANGKHEDALAEMRLLFKENLARFPSK